MKIPLTALVDVISIDLAGPLPTSGEGNKYALIAMEHLKGCNIAKVTQDGTSATIIKFMREEVLFHFGPPKVVFSDKATSFTAKSHFKFKKANETS